MAGVTGSRLKTGQDWDDQIVVENIAGCRNPSRKKDRQGARLLAIREARYKLIFDFQHGSDQLFDLQTDPGESNPLPNDTAKPVRRRLLECAHRHIAQVPLLSGCGAAGGPGIAQSHA